MSKKINRPKIHQGQVLKIPNPNPPDPELAPPKFSFQYLDSHPDYSFEACNDELLSQFVKKLRKLSQLTWRQIHQAPKHGLGSEIIPRPALKRPPPKHITEDVKILAFRCFGKNPMVGYRDDDGVFHIIWLDRNHSLYS